MVEKPGKYDLVLQYVITRSEFSLLIFPFYPDVLRREQHDSANMSAVLDQKNYIEELNRHLK